MKTLIGNIFNTDVELTRCKMSRWPALLVALLLAAISADAAALIIVKVHADFPISGFVSGPVFGSSGPEVFDVVFHIDETAAVHYPAGFEVAPGEFVLKHDVYAIDRSAIQGSTFNFGNQTFSEPYLNNLSFALLQHGNIVAAMFLSDITPGSSPFIEVIPSHVSLGSYDFGPFVVPRQVFLTNGAQVYDGVNSAFGVVQVNVSAVPEPETYTLLLAGFGLLGFAVRRRQ